MKTYTVDFTEDELAFLVAFHSMNSHADWNAILKIDQYRNDDKQAMYDFLITNENSWVLYNKMMATFVSNYKLTEISKDKQKELWIKAVNSNETELSFSEWVDEFMYGPEYIKTKFGNIYQ